MLFLPLVKENIMDDFYNKPIKLNTEFLQRIQEEQILKSLPREDLIKKLKEECKLECPFPKHIKKSYLIDAILEAKYGKEVPAQKDGS
jgi:hypothetical protein